MQKDRMGSTSQILDGSGNRMALKGYDPFGKPRNGIDWSMMSAPALSFEDESSVDPISGVGNTASIDVSKRGFTGHEHLDSFELIHMNGRMYDFNNGRFLSVDPFIQGSTSQSINPYSYVQNNPLSGVDPTGYQASCSRVLDLNNCPEDSPFQNEKNNASTYKTAWLNGVKSTSYSPSQSGNNDRDPSTLGRFKSGVDGDFSNPEFLKEQFRKHAPNEKQEKKPGQIEEFVDTAGDTLRFMYNSPFVVLDAIGQGLARIEGEINTLATALPPQASAGVKLGSLGLAWLGRSASAFGKAAQILDDVWSLSPTVRGQVIESRLAVSEYKDWYNIGNSQNGFFPLVDFQKGINLVSLKSVDTTGSSWVTRMQDHIRDLGSRAATVNGQRANMILDLRVQPGGAGQAQQLIDYGSRQGVTVVVKEY